MLESIAFIPDGNRRYAKQAGISLTHSYSLGTQKAWHVLDWITKYKSIKVGTFYTFSLKNFNRSKTELSILFKLFENQLDAIKERDILVHGKIAVKFLGRRDLFPKKLQKKMSAVEEYTANLGNKRTINLALGYDGQTEIIDAAQKFAHDVMQGTADANELTVDSFRKYLYSDFKEPDLIVRTSDTQRLSGFLTFQSSYSELAFINKYWPALTEKDVDKVVLDYESRERRFGK